MRHVLLDQLPSTETLHPLSSPFTLYFLSLFNTHRVVAAPRCQYRFWHSLFVPSCICVQLGETQRLHHVRRVPSCSRVSWQSINGRTLLQNHPPFLKGLADGTKELATCLLRVPNPAILGLNRAVRTKPAYVCKRKRAGTSRTSAFLLSCVCLFSFLPHLFSLFFFLFLPPTLTYMTRLHVGACVCDIFLRTDPITHDVVHDVGWLGVRRYATCPRDFLQRAQKKCGNTFTVKLMGWNMTYFMSSEGHHTFFSAKEEVYDIREAYKCTVVTFGPGVCYDCPVRKMGEQLGT